MPFGRCLCARMFNYLHVHQVTIYEAKLYLSTCIECQEILNISPILRHSIPPFLWYCLVPALILSGLIWWQLNPFSSQLLWCLVVMCFIHKTLLCLLYKDKNGKLILFWENLLVTLHQDKTRESINDGIICKTFVASAVRRKSEYRKFCLRCFERDCCSSFWASCYSS